MILKKYNYLAPSIIIKCIDNYKYLFDFLLRNNVLCTTEFKKNIHLLYCFSVGCSTKNNTKVLFICALSSLKAIIKVTQWNSLIAKRWLWVRSRLEVLNYFH